METYKLLLKDRNIENLQFIMTRNYNDNVVVADFYNNNFDLYWWIMDKTYKKINGLLDNEYKERLNNKETKKLAIQWINPSEGYFTFFSSKRFYLRRGSNGLVSTFMYINNKFCKITILHAHITFKTIFPKAISVTLTGYNSDLGLETETSKL